MKNFNLFILCFVLVLIQISVLGSFASSARVPNLVLALAVSLVVYRGLDKYLGWIILSGFLLGTGASWPLGSDTLLLVLIAFGIDKLNVFSDIKSRRLLFYPSLALIFAASLFLFDWASFGLLNVEKYILKNNQVLFLPHFFSVDYFFKIIFTILGGFAIYFLIRRMETNDFPKVFQQKASS